MRLAGYDYSQVGACFFTVCVRDRIALFGNVVGSQSLLNEAGSVVMVSNDASLRELRQYIVDNPARWRAG